MNTGAQRKHSAPPAFLYKISSGNNLMIKRFLSSQLRINMASGMATTVVNIAVMAAGYPIYLHFLGYEKYGVWLVLATVLSFAQLGNLGIGQAVMKLVAEDYGRNDIKGIQRYVTTALTMLSVSGIIVLSVILAFKIQIIALFKLNDENAEMAAWLLPYIGILSIYVFTVQTLNATLSGLGRMDLANYIQSIGKIVAVTVAAVLLYNGRGTESLLIGNILSYAFIQVASLICIRRIAAIRLLRLDNLDVQRGKHLLSFGGAVFGGSLISMFLSPFNKIMLSRYAGVSTIPVYEIAFNGSMQIRALFEAGLRAMMPEISRISAILTRHAKDRISQIYRRAMRLICLFGIPMYGGLIIFLTPLLKFWLRQRFVDELPIAFRIMLISTFISLLSVPSYYTFLGSGMVRYTLISHIILSGINILMVLAIVVIWHKISVETVSWAILTATTLTTLYLNWQNKRRM